MKLFTYVCGIKFYAKECQNANPAVTVP